MWGDGAVLWSGSAVSCIVMVLCCVGDGAVLCGVMVQCCVER